MQTRRHLTAFIASVLATTAWAQSTPKPLNLTLPPGSVAPASTSTTPAHAASAIPAAPTSVAAAATTHAPASRASQPGVYYGDTSGRMGNTHVNQALACDDSSYNQARVHGSVGTGVVAGSGVSGNYQSGTVHVTKAFGSCDHPTGGISISIGVSQGNFHGPRHRR